VAPGRSSHPDAEHLPAGALVESPLQLLCTIEAHAAGLGGRPTVVHVRDDVPALTDAARAVEAFGLPEGVRLEVVGRRAALGKREPSWIVGDAFSGVFQVRLLVHGPRTLVLVDDGLATLELARQLASGAPLTRVGQRVGAARRLLGSLATARLRRLARAGRVRLFTALPLEPDVARRIEELGVDVEHDSFSWLASRPAGDAPPEPTVVVGSAMVADGLIDPQAYLTWIRGLADEGPVRYLPHRRNDPGILAALAATPDVTVDAPGAPVELRLRGLQHGQRVVSLPSTSAVLLTTILAARDVLVLPRAVPDAWWTPRAARSLREHLSSVLELAAHARTDAARVTPGHPLAKSPQTRPQNDPEARR
jgi:hypothetical protein